MSLPARQWVDAEQTRALEALLVDLDADALRWVSGFVAGLAAERARGSSPAPAPVSDKSARATVLYASQTGNGRRIAERLGRSLEAAGLSARVVAAGDYALRELSAERVLYVVASTHGDGEPPDDARGLIDTVLSRRAPKLEQLSYAVLALGDSSYPQFCATGRALDARLGELGARRLAERIECDVDFEAKATGWIEQSVTLARAALPSQAPKLSVVVPRREKALATREAPLAIEVLANQRITSADAERDVRHLEFALPSEGFSYTAGDALGVWIDNADALVARVLESTGLAGEVAVEIDGVSRPLSEWLTRERELTRVARPLIEALAARSGDATLAEWLRPEAAGELRARLKQLQVPDLLAAHPAAWTPEALVRALHPLSPRLYSIASAPEAVGEEVHLTVAVVDEIHDGQRHLGVASSHLARLEVGATVRAFIEKNTRFRLPSDASKDVIMIGPGTGVAPFRGFVQAREAVGATGRHWLFFGGRHLERDFLYQTEWLSALKKGVLTRLDVAFSRDTDRKVYVQQRLLERGAELYAWLEAGASVYVCGDAERMAPDVHAALVTVIATHGGRSREDAEHYLADLGAARRYLRDVY
jgi:sulfite reductase (NADPH) flavoprotein alpha-component